MKSPIRNNNNSNNNNDDDNKSKVENHVNIIFPTTHPTRFAQDSGSRQGRYFIFPNDSEQRSVRVKKHWIDHTGGSQGGDVIRAVTAEFAFLSSSQGLDAF